MATSIQATHDSSILERTVGSSSDLNRAFRKLTEGLTVGKLGDMVDLADDLSGASSLESRTANRLLLNLNDGLSMAQVAMGGLDEMIFRLQEVREVAVKAANRNLTENERSGLQEEAETMESALQEIAHKTIYNGRQLLGMDATITLQTGPREADVTYASLSNINSFITTADLSSAVTADTSITAIDTDLANMRRLRAHFESLQASLHNNLGEMSSRLQAAAARGGANAPATEEAVKLSNLIVSESAKALNSHVYLSGVRLDGLL
ncbi:MAG: hypothetical protein HQL82_09950 [Magnetococcales bacterium]|nr:hypothetical protein [Magnetococcales bacterium]